jgi:hypothetical protein
MAPRHTEQRAVPGTSRPDMWTPYKVWCGDLWKCPNCKIEIVVGIGRHPIRERHQDGFDTTIAHTGADQLKVNDC